MGVMNKISLSLIYGLLLGESDIFKNPMSRYAQPANK
jgi:hypothetical protein